MKVIFPAPAKAAMVISFVFLVSIFFSGLSWAQEAMPSEFEISPGETVSFSTSDSNHTSFSMTNSGPDFLAQVQLLWTDTNNNPRDVALTVSGINQPNKDVYSYGFAGAQVRVVNNSPRSSVTVSTSFDYNP